MTSRHLPDRDPDADPATARGAKVSRAALPLTVVGLAAIVVALSACPRVQAHRLHTGTALAKPGCADPGACRRVT